jgi:hypothetical protein
MSRLAWPKAVLVPQARWQARAENRSSSILVFKAILAHGFVGVGNGRRDYISAARPFAQVDQATAVAAKREVRIGGVRWLFADRAAEFDGSLTGHKD